MKNQTDKNGNRQGLWEYYFSEGKLWYKEYYKNGRPHGRWEWYHPDGTLGYKGSYKRGTQIGLWYEPYQ